jgi:hypothetical protein
MGKKVYPHQQRLMDAMTGTTERGGTVTGRWPAKGPEVQFLKPAAPGKTEAMLRDLRKQMRHAYGLQPYIVEGTPNLSESWVEERFKRPAAEIDYSVAEERIMALYAKELVEGFAREFIGKALGYWIIYSGSFDMVQERIDEEGCGAFMAAAKLHLVDDPLAHNHPWA